MSVYKRLWIDAHQIWFHDVNKKVGTKLPSLPVCSLTNSIKSQLSKNKDRDSWLRIWTLNSSLFPSLARKLAPSRFITGIITLQIALICPCLVWTPLSSQFQTCQFLLHSLFTAAILNRTLTVVITINMCRLSCRMILARSGRLPACWPRTS